MLISIYKALSVVIAKPYIVPRQNEISTPADEQPRKIKITVKSREEQDNF